MPGLCERGHVIGLDRPFQAPGYPSGALVQAHRPFGTEPLHDVGDQSANLLDLLGQPATGMAPGREHAGLLGTFEWPSGQVDLVGESQGAEVAAGAAHGLVIGGAFSRWSFAASATRNIGRADHAVAAAVPHGCKRAKTNAQSVLKGMCGAGDSALL
jgi:hypothetical protein